MTFTKSLFRFIITLLRAVLEVTLRFLWLMLPLGVHLFLVQMREKADSVTILTDYVDANSTWTVVYDDAVIVNTKPGALRKKFKQIKTWFADRKYLWIVLFCLYMLLMITYIAKAI